MSPLLDGLALLAGGLGLFLLGMDMLSDGLKLAAGAALRQILQRATRTRWQALGSGVLVTALVQSSSAVTVAAIGFVNAGLLDLGPALWVLFGANVGTTMTGWIVALLGLRLKIESLALPLVGVGMLMRLGGEGRRRSAWGQALAGFGLLFFGIALLQQAFGGLADQLSLPQAHDLRAVLSQLGIGLLLTVLMQSSSASIAMALTAAQGGLIDAQGAAAVVIGANVGTTITALLAAMGATANARRAAAAHVVFNLVTALFALALLPWLLTVLATVREAFSLPRDPAFNVALFHTSFNLLGVLLMWPLAAPLTRWLQRRFRRREDDPAQARFLDDNVLAVPALALEALEREVQRISQRALALLRQVLAGQDGAALAHDRAVLAGLDSAAEAFVERMNRSAMATATSLRLALVLRVLRYLETAAEQAMAAAPFRLDDAAGPAANAAMHQWVAQARAVLDRCEAMPMARPDRAVDVNASADTTPPGEVKPSLDLSAAESAYQALKAELLAAGAAGRLHLSAMEDALRHASALRRALQQVVKAAEHLPVAGPHAASASRPAAH
jgi:phosphate:Na+ symporter